MSIQNFYANAITNDFARLFQFRIVSWKNSQGIEIFTPDELIYVETASLPGKAINNVPVPYMGLSFNVPGTVSFPGSAAWALAIRCDTKYAIRSRLEQLITNTFSAASTSGQYDTPNTNCLITMDLYGKLANGNEMVTVRRYTFVGAYLVSLADTAYDVKDTGSISMINATLAYQYWQAERTAGSNIVNNNAAGGGSSPFALE